MKRKDCNPNSQTPMPLKLRSFSAIYAIRLIQLFLGWPNISSCTATPSLGNHSAVNTVTRSMWAWAPLRCTFGPTRYLVSARSVARRFPDPGCYKDTSELTLGRSLFLALTATEHLQTGPTWGLICRPILMSRNTSAKTAPKPSPECLFCTNMRNLAAA